MSADRQPIPPPPSPFRWNRELAVHGYAKKEVLGL